MQKFTKEKEIVSRLLAFGNITPNGSKPWDITVHNEAFYGRVLSRGSLGLGESYMEGWWDCPELDQFFYQLMRGNVNHKLKINTTVVLYYLKNRLLNLQKKSRAFDVAKKHYDIGNNLYELMLGKTMAYTCGYWKNAGNLDQAQEAKYDLVCKKIGLRPGMKILDLGCGFGGFMKFAAEKYKVSAVGVTVSKEQVKFGREMCAGLPIDIQLKDYRDVEGKFDRIVSIGLMEHVGHKNYRTLFQTAYKHVTDDGLCLFHTIGSNSSNPAHSSDPWIAKYIFPNGMMPSAKQIAESSMENLFILEDWHNFGADYDKTLMAWYHNFKTHWPSLKKDYGDVFYRMWSYYLLSCAGSFRNRSIQLWQIVLSKKGVPGGYDSIR